MLNKDFSNDLQTSRLAIKHGNDFTIKSACKGRKKWWAINRKLKVNSCLVIPTKNWWWKIWKFHGRRKPSSKREISHLIRKFNWKILLCSPPIPTHPFHMFFEVTSWKQFFVIEQLRHDEKWNCFLSTKFPLPFFCCNTWILLYLLLLRQQHLHTVCYLQKKEQTSTSIFTGALLLKYCSRIACFTIIKELTACEEENFAICIPRWKHSFV